MKILAILSLLSLAACATFTQSDIQPPTWPIPLENPIRVKLTEIEAKVFLNDSLLNLEEPGANDGWQARQIAKQIKTAYEPENVEKTRVRHQKVLGEMVVAVDEASEDYELLIETIPTVHIHSDFTYELITWLTLGLFPSSVKTNIDSLVNFKDRDGKLLHSFNMNLGSETWRNIIFLPIMPFYSPIEKGREQEALWLKSVLSEANKKGLLEIQDIAP